MKMRLKGMTDAIRIRRALTMPPPVPCGLPAGVPTFAADRSSVAIR
jgi:hypothetical protein